MLKVELSSSVRINTRCRIIIFHWNTLVISPRRKARRGKTKITFFILTSASFASLRERYLFLLVYWWISPRRRARREMIKNDSVLCFLCRLCERKMNSWQFKHLNSLCFTVDWFYGYKQFYYWIWSGYPFEFFLRYIHRNGTVGTFCAKTSIARI